MANDILIDMGEKWGHVVPLSMLEQIKHIEVLEDGHMQVICEQPDEMKNKTFRFKSRKPFDEDELSFEKTRLLGYSNGLIQREEVERILKSMSSQLGVELEELLSDAVYDISFLRRLWATHMGIPFFRFVLQYDPETQNVEVEEDHNGEFENHVLPSWTDPDVIKDLNEDDRGLLFAYEVVYKMAEPILPEDEDGAFTDPMANIPVMGVKGVSTQVDLAGTTPDQVVQSFGSKRE